MDNYPFISQVVENSLRVSAKASLEQRLEQWSRPPSASEIEKCERAERMIKEAILNDPILSKKNIKIFAKGSYANRTNIPSDSDVDVAVVNQDLFFNDYPKDKTDSDFGFYKSTYVFSEFSKDVAKAVENKFGKSEVTIDDKCIKVRSNTCRVDADVVPQAIHRRYSDNGKYIEGVALQTSGRLIYNWPQQDYDNGVNKNTATGKTYKALVRIFKNLRSEMEANGIKTSKFAKSYLLACLAWNVPNEILNQDTYQKIVNDSLTYLINQTSSSTSVSEWGEVNELKYLFRSSQPWNVEEVHIFLVDAKKYLERY